MNPLPSRLLAVTDRHQAGAPLVEVVAGLFDAGLRWLWLRDRDLPALERRALAHSLKCLAGDAGAALTVGADIELAAAVRATGVHLRGAPDVAEARRRLGAGVLLGVSAHSLAEVLAAQTAGADYVTLSPIFTSASKPGYGPALGLAALKEAARCGIPVLALGGVTGETARACIDAGAAGVAMMGPMMRKEPPQYLVAFHASLEAGRPN